MNLGNVLSSRVLLALEISIRNACSSYPRRVIYVRLNRIGSASLFLFMILARLLLNNLFRIKVLGSRRESIPEICSS